MNRRGGLCMRRKIFKRLLSLTIVACLVFSMISVASVNSFAAETDGSSVVKIATACEGKTLAQVKKYYKSKGYTMYKPEYSSYWCAWFISNCAKAAKVSTKTFGHFTYADGPGFLGWAKDKGIYKKRGKYTPKIGDIVFFDWGSGVAHVELVRKVSDSYIYTVGGNTGNSNPSKSTVQLRKWKKSCSNIAGYASIAYKKTSYTASFKAGTSDAVANMPKTQTVKAGEYLYLNKLSVPSRNGYTFVGWKNSANGKIYKNSLKIGGNRTFTAQWEDNNTAVDLGLTLKNGSDNNIYISWKDVAEEYVISYGKTSACSDGNYTTSNNSVKYMNPVEGKTYYFKVDFDNSKKYKNKSKSIVSKSLHNINYDSKYCSVASSNVWYGNSITITTKKPVRSGRVFAGKYRLKRLSDTKYYVSNVGWCSWDEIEKKGYTTKAYIPGKTYTVDSSWIKGCEDSNYTLIPLWKKQ